MEEIKVRRLHEKAANVSQLSGTRDWMDATQEKHGYMCFPLTLSNRLGWGISFDRDVRFIWDGIEDTSPDHVTILEGEEIAYTGRGHATVSFETGFVVSTSENISMLTMPVPNQFIRGLQTFTTLMSTSFYRGDFPLAIKITEPNKEICIPSGTPIAALLPISIGNLQDNYELKITEGTFPPEHWEELRKYGEAAEAKNAVGEWSRMYRDATNYDGSSMGKHESKNIKLKTTVCPITGATSESTN
jgi:hypothetical protein